MKMLVLIAVVLMAARVQGDELLNLQEESLVLCGRNLADARMLFCYSLAQAQKKSSDPAFNAVLYPPKQQNAEVPWLQATRQRVLASIAAGAKLDSTQAKEARSIVDECCLKPCCINDILKYC